MIFIGDVTGNGDAHAYTDGKGDGNGSASGDSSGDVTGDSSCVRRGDGSMNKDFLPSFHFTVISTESELL